MRRSSKWFVVLATLGFTAAIAGAVVILNIEANQEKLKGVTFKIAAGVSRHEGTISNIAGELQLDPANGQLLSGQMIVPIADVSTGHDKRDCHMREALGLDYAVSEFPKVHVCTTDHKLPETGPNAVAFPEITLALRSARVLGTAVPANLNSPKQEVEIDATWTIHGVQKDVVLKAEVEPLAGQKYHFVGQTTLLLSDFNIQVKPFGPVAVDNKAHVFVDVTLTALPVVPGASAQ